MIKQIKAPILPVEAYTSKEWFELEKEKIFSNTWQYAGLIEDLSHPGDYITTQCGNQNILVVKGKDEKLRAFHNICRHRGTQLLRAVGKKQTAITCPYHDWTYNLSGQLISVPEKETEFPDLELDKICLHKASVDTWRGIIWVHPNPEADPNTTWFKGIEEQLGPHYPERLKEYPNTTYEKVINANWKIVVENFIDVYHLSHLHASTLNMYDHAKAEHQFIGDHWVFREPLTKKYRDNLEDLNPFKRIKEVTDDHLGAYVPWLFPSIGITESESLWSTFHVIPLAPDKTKVVIRTKFEEISTWELTKRSAKYYFSWNRTMSKRAKYKNGDKNDPMASGDIMEEDIYACEQLQKSLNNPLFDIVATAKNQESTIIDFQKIVKKWLDKD
ncbi:MAG: aromatic ring-hydroxylating dioxygenase subunit alpha [Bacteroidota bacterium]